MKLGGVGPKKMLADVSALLSWKKKALLFSPGLPTPISYRQHGQRGGAQGGAAVTGRRPPGPPVGAQPPRSSGICGRGLGAGPTPPGLLPAALQKRRALRKACGDMRGGRRVGELGDHFICCIT